MSLKVSPGGLSFGSQLVGVVSALQTVTVVNAGSVAANNVAVSITGDFSQTNSCPGSLGTESLCTVLVYFTPTQAGARTGTLSVASSAPGSPQTVSLSGTGLSPTAQISTGNLTFVNQAVGTASAPQGVTLTNTGTTPFQVGPVNISGDFSQTSNCPVSLAGGSSCKFQVVFMPTATGTRRGALSITTTAPNSLPQVSLTGTGVNSSAQVTPPSLMFGNQNVGTTSASQAVTLKNPGESVLTISNVTASANFGETNNCGSSLAAASSCTINVTFSPTAAGSLTGTLTIIDDNMGVAGSTQTVSLSGNGTAPSLSLSPAGLIFGSQTLKTTSAPSPVTVTNNGTASLTFTGIAVTGDFAIAPSGTTCSTSTPVTAGGHCAINVTFTPTAIGVRTGSLTLTDNASGSPQTVTLTGNEAITLTPTSAAVAPGGTVEFSLPAGVSASSITWSVNGIVGGSATVGTISSQGVYKAPQVSSALLVNVQATVTSNTNLSASASMAIMPPGTVSTTNNPQVALYTFNVPEASTVSIQFGPDTNYGLDTWTQTTPSGGGQVKIFVAGMRGFTTYHMRAVVQLSDGTQFNDSDHVFTTGGLTAAQMPSLTATTTPGMIPNSGIEMLDLMYLTPVGTAENVVATDLSGNVIWYFDLGNPDLIPQPVKLLPDGNMLINYDNNGPDGLNSVLKEVDLGGDVVWEMNADDLNAALATAGYDITINGTHHDVAILPDGHLILIASMTKNFTDLTGYPGTTAVTGDVLIDLDTNRTPVWVWSEFDHLDVNRHPMNFPDWTHTNAVLYSSSDGDLVISVRHQYWLIKIDYNDGLGSGDIVWKLGWQGDFTLVGGTDPVDWFYAQHGPSFLTDQTSGVYQLVLFDNGDDRPNEANAGLPCGTTPVSPCYSTVPILQLDETAKTATIVWHDNLSPVFSFFGGNAEVLDNGNVEFAVSASGGSSTAGAVYEVTQDPTPQTVWQLQIAGQYAYRAMRMPSLYPGVQW
jgi:hypothetical protein